MAVVFKGNNGGDKKGPLGAWIGYGAVAVFGIAVVFLTLFGGQQQPDPMDSSYSYSDYKDLADMPFSDDAAEAELLASVRYGDIAKNDLINALFSEDEKEARQADDKANGAPPPPDEEYAEAAKEKEKVRSAKARYRKSRQAAIQARAERTTKGSLSASSGVRAGSGGGSGVSATIWRANDKKNGNGNSASVSARGASQANTQFLNQMKGGRGGGFMAAYEKSQAAANAQNLDDAHALAADAFQNAGDLEADLKGELEDLASELNFDKAMEAIDKDKGGTNDLDEKLSEAKDDANKKDRNKRDYKCDGAMINGQIDMSCVMSGLMQGLFDAGKQALSAWVQNSIGSNKETALNAKRVAEARVEVDELDRQLKDENLKAEDRPGLIQRKKDLEGEIAFFSTPGATLKKWNKANNPKTKKNKS